MGSIDLLSFDTVFGWAVDLDSPAESLILELMIDDVVIGKTAADQPRGDLNNLGFDRTNFGFYFDLSGRQIPSLPEVRISGTGIVLTELEGVFCLTGVVERLSWTVISGWAWRIGRKDESVEVDVLIGGRLVRTLKADRARDDLAKAGMGGRHGFMFDPRKVIEREKFHADDVKIVYHGTQTSLPMLSSATTEVALSASGSAPSSEAATFLSAKMSCVRGMLRGWVHNSLTQAPERIEIRVDGELIWRGEARRLEDVIVEGAQVRRPAGFRVQLPSPTAWTDSRRIELQTTAGAHLPGSPLVVPYGDQFIGNVERVIRQDDRLTIRGWCIDTQQPSARVPISIFYKELMVSEGATDKRRPDLSVTGFDAPSGGFELSVEKDPGLIVDLSALIVRPGYAARAALPMTAAEIEVVDGREAPAGETGRGMTQPKQEIEGTIDEVSERAIHGWARNKTDPNAMVVLDCFIDGFLYATTAASRFRADLKKHFNDHGFHQYVFELTPALEFQRPGNIEVVPRVGRSKVKQKFTTLNRAIPLSRILPAQTMNYLDNFRVAMPSNFQTETKVALIVINKNGAELLSTFLSAFYEYNTYEDYEIVVVDHGSMDDSEQVCEKWTKRLTLRWFQRGGNFSFSDSNNFGAEQTDADLLLFINNDIRFCEDVVGRLVRYMGDAKIGCMGIRLSDDSPLFREDLKSAIQHLGVHFQASYRGFAVEAFESRYCDLWKGVAHAPVEVPAVTGAFMVCRREEFLALGGFHERYFYGYEDVDLCLMYQLRGQEVVCANDLSAFHLRGFSRDRMDKRFDRVRVRNRFVLDERFGYWLRRTLAAQRFAPAGFLEQYDTAHSLCGDGGDRHHFGWRLLHRAGIG